MFKYFSLSLPAAFGQPFDEIVVDTSLTVKKKNPNRQSRTQNGTKTQNRPITASLVAVEPNKN